MSDDSPSVATSAQLAHDLTNRIYTLSTVDELPVIAGEVDALRQSGTLAAPAAFDLLQRVFYATEQVGGVELALTEKLMLDFLVPLCLTDDDDAAPGNAVALQRFRETLTSWLRQIPGLRGVQLRDEVVGHATKLLSSPHPIGACWTLANIGYRSDEVVDGLWNLAAGTSTEWDARKNRVAVSTLTNLGIPDSERPRLLAALHPLASLDWSVPVWGAIRRLADKRSAGVLLSTWLKPEDSGQLPEHAATALGAFTDIADAAWDDSEFQDQTWNRIAQLAGNHSEQLSGRLYLSNIAASFNTPNVIRTLLTWLAERPDQSDHMRYLLCLRMSECVRPQQLAGWADAGGRRAIKALTHHSQINSGGGGRDISSEGNLKEIAWETLLRLGYPKVLEWYGSAVADESSQYLAAHISDLLACFHLRPVPRQALRLVTEPYAETSGSPNFQLPARTAATQIARSAPSMETFHALLTFGYTIDGQVLMDSVNALTDVARVVAKSKRTEVVQALLDAADHGEAPRHRSAASAALASLSEEELLPPWGIQGMQALLRSRRLTSFDKSQIVDALRALPTKRLDRETVTLLLRWCRVDATDDLLQYRALAMLVVHGILAWDSQLFAKRLQLRLQRGSWHVAGTIGGEEAFVVGILFRKYPDQFVSCVIEIIQEGAWDSSIQMARMLPNEDESLSIRSRISNVLRDRIRDEPSFMSTRGEMLTALARRDPETLARETWDVVWEEWDPADRISLAEELAETMLVTDEARESAVGQLVELVRDGQYAVRRAAYKGLRNRSSSTLETACSTWAAPEAPVELRLRAAEGSAWLPTRNSDRNEGSPLLHQLLMDREPTVREAAQRAYEERRKHAWAMSYLAKLTISKNWGNADVLDHWRYADALARIGDDECIEILQEHARDPDLAPHARHWMVRALKQLQDQWQTTQKDWPKPILHWDGELPVSDASAFRLT